MGFWLLRGYVSEGRNYVRASLALPAVQAAKSRMDTRSMSVPRSRTVRGSTPKPNACSPNVSRCAESSITFDLAATLSTRSLVMLHAGQAAEARRDESEAVDLFRKLEHRVGEAMALLHLGQIEAYVGNDDDACRYLEQGISIARDIGYAEVEGECN